jgi:hypothetical protein
MEEIGSQPGPNPESAVSTSQPFLSPNQRSCGLEPRSLTTCPSHPTPNWLQQFFMTPDSSAPPTPSSKIVWLSFNSPCAVSSVCFIILYWYTFSAAQVLYRHHLPASTRNHLEGKEEGGDLHAHNSGDPCSRPILRRDNPAKGSYTSPGTGSSLRINLTW